MRSYWIWNLAALVSLVGCTMSGTQHSASRPVTAKASWSEKMAAPFAALAPKKGPQPVVNPAPATPDPLSLNFGSGKASPALYVSMGQMSDQGGNSAHARAMYQKALSMESNNIDALLGLARLEDREGNLQVALQLYHQAAHHHPQDARPVNDLGLCYARGGQMQPSLECLAEAVRLRPDKPLYRNNIAKVLIETNQLDAALSHLGAVYDPATARYNMAALLDERGRSQEAIPYLHQALAAKPDMNEATALLSSLTGAAPAAADQHSIASAGPALSSPITVSAPIATTHPIVNQSTTHSAAIQTPVINGQVAMQPGAPRTTSTPVGTVNHNDIVPTPYRPGETEVITYSYPSTGAPPKIPVPVQTARVPVGFEPALLPPIR